MSAWVKRVVVSVVVVLLSGLVVPTAAADDGGWVRAGAVMDLTVTDAYGYDRTVQLSCMPAGGTHPNPWPACAVLMAAGGDFDRIRPWTWETCTEEYDPVTLSARGQWLGHVVDWEQSYPNACYGRVDTAGVFNF